MESLKNYTAQLRRQIDARTAWSCLNTNFVGNKAQRFVYGMCISSLAKNAHGDAYYADGVTVDLPIPFLLNHSWMRPLGRIVMVEAHGEQLQWKAELANSGRIEWVETMWERIRSQQATRISMHAFELSNETRNGALSDWLLSEVSLVDEGADRGARILKCWKKEQYVSLREPTEKIYWDWTHAAG